MAWSILEAPPAVAIVVALVLATVVLSINGGRSVNRRLALVCILEAAYASTALAAQLLNDADADQPQVLRAASVFTLDALTVSYLALLSWLDAPVARFFRRPSVLAVLWSFVGIFALTSLIYGTPENPNAPAAWMNIIELLGALFLIGGGVLGIVITVSAFRRTVPNSPARRRARAILVAFVARDALLVVTVVGGIALGTMGRDVLAEAFWTIGIPVAIIVYIPILTYGILKAQVFDIDLKLKWGISRAAVVSLVVVSALVGAKIVEAYVNRNVGYVVGAVVAGLVLFWGPRLNRLADRVADKAAPKVTPTNEYLAYRKLEVYRAAYESAMEAGGIDTKERDILERLRTKIGLKAEDTTALETELRATAPTTLATPTPNTGSA